MGNLRDVLSYRRQRNWETGHAHGAGAITVQSGFERSTSFQQRLKNPRFRSSQLRFCNLLIKRVDDLGG